MYQGTSLSLQGTGATLERREVTPAGRKSYPIPHCKLWVLSGLNVFELMRRVLFWWSVLGTCTVTGTERLVSLHVTVTLDVQWVLQDF